MEHQTGAANQRFAEYCNKRGVDEDEAVIAMTVTCHVDDLNIIHKLGYGAATISKEPCHIMQVAGILRVGMGGKQTWVDWTKVEYYLSLGEKLRN